ncbi:unnamed protein product, partial [Ostreobium quekettii]
MTTLVSRCPSNFVSCNGVSAVLRFIQDCWDHDLLVSALILIQSAVSASRDLQSDFGSDEGMRAVLMCLSNTASPEDVRLSAVLVASQLCRGHEANQRRFANQRGLPFLISDLERLKSLDPTLPSPYAIAAFRLVWEAVVANPRNLARFSMAGGIDSLLDLVELGNTCHKPTLLSLLSDIFERRETHRFFHEWRSSVSGQTASEMLIGMWREAEDMKGVTCDGMVFNTKRPLAGSGVQT